ncbi:hypothetical protein WR25_18733 [Diploscapter pachys]|uniref:Uncharacterized protein n=1 Tax=Diploscapter pachys TaxID=2018661 RepID=A0A2A2K462_9BILA|nr:hypothetical protein WR25_18733 [Diploscapter pachys]
MLVSGNVVARNEEHKAAVVLACILDGKSSYFISFPHATNLAIIGLFNDDSFSARLLDEHLGELPEHNSSFPIPSPSLDSHNQIDVGPLFALPEHAVQRPDGDVRRPVERILEFPLAVVDGRVDGGVLARGGHRVAEHDRRGLQQATRHLKLKDV